MKYKCPVCNTEYSQNVIKCEVCKFTNKFGIDQPWPITEDTEKWLNTVVKPYREKWHSSIKENSTPQLRAEDYSGVKSSYTAKRDKNESGYEMALVPSGSFMMGNKNHKVMPSAFYIGRTEVTQELYESVTGNNPSHFKGGNLPVEQVTWYDAIEFCNKLSEMDGLQPVYTISGRTPAAGYPITSATGTVDLHRNGYRLPTVAEWMYAAKGGNGSPGNYTYAGSNNVDSVAWYRGNSGKTTHAVGTKAPNGLGIYDMSGNVWEWCWDWYTFYFFGQDPKACPVALGGGWRDSARHVRSVVGQYRYDASVFYRHFDLGFRLVRH